MPTQKTYTEFSADIKAKYPQYKDVDDLELAKKIVSKYPQYDGVVQFDEVAPVQPQNTQLSDMDKLRLGSFEQAPMNLSLQDKPKGQFLPPVQTPQAQIYNPKQSSNEGLEFTQETVVNSRPNIAKEFIDNGESVNKGRGAAVVATEKSNEYLSNPENIASAQYDKIMQNDGNNDYSTEEVNAVFDAMPPKKQYEEWMKNKDVWDDRPYIQSVKTVGEKETGFWGSGAGDIIQALNAGGAAVGGGLSEFMHQNIEKPLYGWMAKPNSRMIWGRLADSFFETQEASSSAAGKENMLDENGQVRQKDFVDYFSEGDYTGGFANLGIGALESAPTSAVAIGASAMGAPMVGLAVIGAQVTGTRKRELDKNNPELSELQKNIIAYTSGAIEAGSEMLGDIPIGKMLGKIYHTGGSAVANQVMGNSVETIIRNTTKQMRNASSILWKAPLSEGGEEFASGVGNYLLDSAMGIQKFNFKEMMTDSGKQAVYGAVAGGGFGLVGAPGVIRNQKVAKQLETLKSNYDIANQNLQTSLEGSNFAFDGESIITRPMAQQQEILAAAYNATNLTDEQKTAIRDYMEAGNSMNAALVNVGLTNIELLRKKAASYQQVTESVNQSTGTIDQMTVQGTADTENYKIKGGKVAFTPEGTVDIDNSDETIYYYTGMILDGVPDVAMITPDNITAVESNNPDKVMQQSFMDIEAEEFVRSEFGAGMDVILNTDMGDMPGTIVAVVPEGLVVNMQGVETVVPFAQAVEDVKVDVSKEDIKAAKKIIKQFSKDAKGNYGYEKFFTEPEAFIAERKSDLQYWLESYQNIIDNEQDETDYDGTNQTKHEYYQRQINETSKQFKYLSEVQKALDTVNGKTTQQSVEEPLTPEGEQEMLPTTPTYAVGTTNADGWVVGEQDENGDYAIHDTDGFLVDRATAEEMGAMGFEPTSNSSNNTESIDLNNIDTDNYIYVMHQTDNVGAENIITNGFDIRNGLNGTVLFGNKESIQNAINSINDGHGHRGSNKLLVYALPKSKFGSVRQLDEISDKMIDEGIYSMPSEYIYGVHTKPVDNGENAPVAETPKTFKEQIPVQPLTDGRGKPTGKSVTMYEQAPIETTIGALKEQFDDVNSVVQTVIDQTNGEITKLSKVKLKGSIDEMAAQNAVLKQQKADASAKLDYWNNVNETLNPVTPLEVVAPKTDSNTDYYNTTSESSNDIEEIVRAHGMAMEESGFETLLPWQQALLGTKIHPTSFKRFGDKNYMNDMRAWFASKKTQLTPNNAIDTIAEVLSQEGIAVTPDMIVEFMREHPQSKALRGNENTANLSERFRKVASKIAGMQIGGIETSTGKLFMKMYNKPQVEIKAAVIDTVIEQQLSIGNEDEVVNDLQNFIDNPELNPFFVAEKELTPEENELIQYFSRWDNGEIRFEHRPSQSEIETINATSIENTSSEQSGDRQSDNSGGDNAGVAGLEEPLAPKGEQDQVSKEEQFNLPIAENIEQFEGNVNWMLENYSSRDMAAIQVENYLNEKGEIGKEYIAKYGITTREELKAFLSKLQAKLRAGKGNERKATLQEMADEKAQANIDGIVAQALKASAEMDVLIAAQEPNTNPSEAQKEAGNYKLAHVVVNGMDISVENPAGSTRSGVDANGKAWSNEMQSHYGYFKGTVGRDGDHVDTFIKPNTPLDFSGKVFVIDQVHVNGPKAGMFDESKVMLGYDSSDEATKAYMANYDKDWNGLSDLTEVSVDDFKTWLYDGKKQAKPFADYKENASPVDSGQLTVDSDVADNVHKYKNGDTVYYKGKQYVINGEYNGEAMYDLETSDGKSAFSEITENELSNEAPFNPLSIVDLANAAVKKNETAKLTQAQQEADEALNDFMSAFNDLNSDNLGIADNSAEKQAKMLMAGTKMVGAFTKLGVYKFSDLVYQLGQKGIQITEELLSAIKKSYGAFAAENDIDELDDMKTVRKFTLNNLEQNEQPTRSTETIASEAAAIDTASELIRSNAANVGSDQQRAGEVKEQASEQITKVESLLFEVESKLEQIRLTDKSYSTDGIAADYPINVLAKGEIKKDLTKYIKAVAEITGFTHDTDKKGKPEIVNVNIAPAGGDATFFLWSKTNPDLGVYVSIPYDPNYSSGGGYDNYKVMNEGWRAEILFRVVNKAKKYDGSNQYMKTDVTAKEMAETLLKAHNQRLKSLNVQPEVAQIIKEVVNGGEKIKKATELTAKKITTSKDLLSLFDEEPTNNQPNDTQRGNKETDSRLGDQEPKESTGLQRNGVDRSNTTDNGVDGGGSVGISDIPTAEGARNTRNNVIPRGREFAPSSPKARFDANIEAIKTLRKLIDSGKQTTKADQQSLRQYSGWGGIGTYFNNRNSSENKTLHEVLTPEEYESAAMSINSAYYTPAVINNALWDIAEKLGFKGGNILEGSAGIGNIIGSMPRSINSNSKIEAVEIDEISGNILKYLYPDAKVSIKGFEDTVIPNGTVDLAITNVPFVTGLHVYDPIDKDLSKKFKNIHDFCIAKNIRKLSEGGIGIFITSNGTLDKSKELREWIGTTGKTDVIGAFRLNNDTFGGTNVTSDIIIVRKRVANQKHPKAIDVLKSTHVRTGEYDTKETAFDKKIGRWAPVMKQTNMEYNDYFKEHPENMGGEMAFAYEKGDTFRPGGVGLYPGTVNQNKQLKQWLENFEDVALEKQVKKEIITENTTAKEGQLILNAQGKLSLSYRGEARDLELNDNKVKGETKAQCLKDYNKIKETLQSVLDYQVANENNDGLKPLLIAFNRAYDNFVAKYGQLNKNTSISFLRNDVDFPSIVSIEKYSETKSIDGLITKNISKTSVFKNRVVAVKTELKPTNTKDAVIASVYKYGAINVPYISESLNIPEQQVIAEIISSKLGFKDPSTGTVIIRHEYLSGDTRSKLKLAELSNDKSEYSNNIEELSKVIPMDIPAHLIEFTMGTSWLDKKLYEDYFSEKFNVKVAVTHSDGRWTVNEGSKTNETNRSAGVYSEMLEVTVYGSDLATAAMNLKTVTVSRVQKTYDGKKETVSDKDATQACNTRVSEIRDDFKEFVRTKLTENKELADKMALEFNERSNSYVPMEIDETYLPERFEGSSETISLHAHQKKATIRGTMEPLMLAHEVGAGKTFVLISTAMEMRRLGTANKPMIVVQNATVGQFVTSAKQLYPNAKILTITENDRTPEGRKMFYAKIKYSDWDIIVVPQSTFEMIPDSPAMQMRFIDEKIEEKMHTLEALKDEADDANKWAISAMEKEIEQLRDEWNATNFEVKKDTKEAKKTAKAVSNVVARTKEQLDRRTDDVQYFDDMGIDALLIDEAHEYKRLGFATVMTRGVKGIDPAGSKKAAGVYLKTRVVLEKSDWKNVVFATGTPISNTAAEIWTFMKYMIPKETLIANEIYYFDDFVRNFGSINQTLEFSTNGSYKENTRFSSYINKPELIRLWASVTDTVLSKDIDAVNDKIPLIEGDKATDIYLPQTPSLIDVMRAVRAELKRFENMTGKEKKENSSIPIVMYGIAKRAAIDARLVSKIAIDEPNSKTNKAVEEVLRSLKDSAKYKGTTAIFCDNQNRWDVDKETGKRVKGFDLFEDIKAKLIKGGVAENEIVIIKPGMTVARKEKIFDAVNSGEIRVVLGNTKTLGTGVNIQERLFTLIHMDAPDRPMDYTQRNGRILRQGNLHKQWGIPVRILRFGVEDSLDVTSYQRLKTKSGFIDSIMDGKGALLDPTNPEGRILEEEEEGLFDNPVAVLSGSQYALLKNQAERELRKWESKKKQHEADQIYIQYQLKDNERTLGWRTGYLKDLEKAQTVMVSKFSKGINTITISGKTINGVESYVADDKVRAKVNEYIKPIAKAINEKTEAARENAYFTKETVTTAMKFNGVEATITTEIERESVWDSKVKLAKIVMHKSQKITIPELGIDVRGFGQSMMQAIEDIYKSIDLDKISNTIARIKSDIQQLESDNAIMIARQGKPFEHIETLATTKLKVKELSELMKIELEAKEEKYRNAGSGNKVDLTEVDTDDEIETIDEAPQFQAVSENGFYSTVENALEKIQQEKGTKDQFKAMLLKNGAKQAEMDWMGFDELPEKLTKAEVQKWIDENRIDVSEVVKGIRNTKVYSELSKEDAYYNLMSDIDVFDENGNKYSQDSLAKSKNSKYFSYNSNIEGELTKFSDYVLPGGENYKELLLTMPVKNESIINEYNSIDKKINDLERSVGLEIPTEQQRVEHDNLRTKLADLKERIGNDALVGDYGKAKPTTEFKSSHYDEANILAHVRFNERTVNGEKVLFVEEFQSDWAQKGKKEGFKASNQNKVQDELNAVISELKKSYEEASTSNFKTEEEAEKFYNKWNNAEAYKTDISYKDIAFENGKIIDLKRNNTPMFFNRLSLNDWTKINNPELLEEKRQLDKQLSMDVPNMPFKKTDQWVNLAARRMMRYAAENGFDRIAWTNGKQQADRYSLAKQVDKIEVENKENDIRYVKIYPIGESYNSFDVDKNGIIVKHAQWEGKRLDEIVGKDVADKILLSETNKTFSGLDLEVGGTGMKAFYDGIVPSAMSKLGKPFGAKVENISLSLKTNDIVDSVFERPNGTWGIAYEQGKFYDTKEQALAALESIRPSDALQQSIPVTDSMKETAMAGLPLYHTGTTLQPTTAAEQAEMVEQLMKTGLAKEVKLVDDAEIKALDKKAARILETSGAHIYGFVKNGVVYLNKNTPNLNTPIHEFGHLWIDAIEGSELFEKGKALVMETHYWTKVNNDPNYSSLSENARAKEAMAMAMGDKGEAVKQNLGLYARIKTWINDVWDKIGAQFGIQNLTSAQIQNLTFNDFTDIAVSELLSGKKLDKSNKNSNFETPNKNNGNTEKTRLDNRGTMESEPKRLPLGAVTSSPSIGRTIAGTTTTNTRTGRTGDAKSQSKPWNKSKGLKQLAAQAKADGTWIADITVLTDGKEHFANGTENNVYYSKDGHKVVKVNNLLFLNDNDLEYAYTRDLNYFYDRISAHNTLFPEDAYNIVGFTENEAGQVCIVMEQPYISSNVHPTIEEIEADLAKSGFTKTTLGEGINQGLTGYTNGIYELTDVKPLNVLTDKNGKFHYIDLDISKTIEKPTPERPKFKGDVSEFAFQIVQDNEAASEQNERKSKMQRLQEIMVAKSALAARHRNKEVNNQEYAKQMLALHEEKLRVMAGLPEPTTTADEDAANDPKPIRTPGQSVTEWASQVADWNYRQTLNKALAGTANSVIGGLPKVDEDTQINNDLLRMELDQRLGGFFGRLVEGWQDNIRSVRIFQELLKERGTKVSDFNNFHMQYTAIQGKNDAHLKDFGKRFMTSINHNVKSIEQYTNYEYRDLENYVFLKHGIERNEYMRQAAAVEAVNAKLPALTQEQIDGDIDGSLQDEYKASYDQMMEEELANVADKDYSGLFAVAAEIYAKENGIKFNPTKKGEVEKVQKMDEFKAERDQVISKFITDFEKTVNDDIIPSVEKGKILTIAGFWADINAASNYSLDRLATGGIESKAEIEDLKARYKYYVPLRGHEVEAEKVWQYEAPDNKNVVSKAIMQASGRKSRAEHPFAYIIQMAQTSINKANRNHINQTMLRLGRQDKSGLMSVSETWYVLTGTDTDSGKEIWTETEPEFSEDHEIRTGEIAAWNEKMKKLEEDGKAKRFQKGLRIGGLFIKPKQKRQHAISVYEDGIAYQVYINGNPRVSQAINELNGTIFRIPLITPMTRFISSMITSRSPQFMLTNGARDLAFASSILPSKEGAKYTAKFLGNYPKAMAILANNATFDFGNDKAQYKKYLKEFEMNGGETGYSHLLELQDIEKDLRQQQKGKNYLNPITDLGVLVDVIDAGNKVIENSTRLAVYISSRESGRSVERSVSDSKEVTLNFNRRGSGIMGAAHVQSIFMFVNAGVQALANFGHVYKMHPVKMSATIGLYAAVGYMLPMIIAAIGGDDDEKEYMNMTDWERQTNLCLPTGNGFMKIPLPQELRVFFKLGDELYKLFSGRTEMVETAMATLMSAADMIPISPLGTIAAGEIGDFGDLQRAISPDALRGVAELATNTNFMGGQIYDKYKAEKDGLPGYEKARLNRVGEARAPQSMVGFTKWLDSFTGGDGTQKGGVSWNPDVVNHLSKSYLGGMYSLIAEGGKSFTKRFYTSKADIEEKNTTVKDYYKRTDVADELIRQEKDYWDKLQNNIINEAEYNKKVDAKRLEQAQDIHDYAREITKIERLLKTGELSAEDEMYYKHESDSLKREVVGIKIK